MFDIGGSFWHDFPNMQQTEIQHEFKKEPSFEFKKEPSLSSSSEGEDESNDEEDEQEILFGLVEHLHNQNLALDLENLAKVVVEKIMSRHLEFRELDPCVYIRTIDWAEEPWLSAELEMAGQGFSMIFNGR